MKKKNLPALGFALALLLVFVIAAAIDYRALNSNQFTTSGTVSVKSGAAVTNLILGGQTVVSRGTPGVQFGVVFKNSAEGVLSFYTEETLAFGGSISEQGFSGLGGGLTNLNASELRSGTISYLRAGSLTNHTDVTVTSLQPGDHLAYAGASGWTNGPSGSSSSGGFTNMAVSTITYGTTITPNLAVANIVTYSTTPRRITFRCTLTGPITTVSPPSGTAVDGDVMVWEMIQDGTGSRTISGFDTIYAFGTDITGITLTTTASKRDFISWTYNSTATKWYCTGFARGY
jgi:hypothetical protein